MMQSSRLTSIEIFSASEWTPTRTKSRLCIRRDATRWRGQPGHSDTSGWFCRLITASENAHKGLQNRSMIKVCIQSLV